MRPELNFSGRFVEPRQVTFSGGPLDGQLQVVSVPEFTVACLVGDRVVHHLYEVRGAIAVHRKVFDPEPAFSD